LLTPTGRDAAHRERLDRTRGRVRDEVAWQLEVEDEAERAEERRVQIKRPERLVEVETTARPE
jgi:hypothetical protein